jgi:type I restriction enzyme S subunit
MSEVAQVPQLRFPEFSGEWEDGKLGNYGNLINGLTYSPDNIVDDGLLVLRSSNVQNGQIYLNDNVYVNLDVDDAALTKEDDILICVRNGSKRLIGKSTIINKNLPKSTHGAFMTVFRGESNKFISHWFHSSIYYKEVHKNLGATINSINGSNLKKFKTIFPLKPEQQKIAVFLSAVDNKIEQLSKKQELLGEYKKGLMQKIFSQAIRFKADDGSEFPDWEEKKLGDLIAEISDGGTPPTSNKGNFGGGINWVVIDDIRDEIRITKETLTETGLSNSSSKLWKPETIILSTGATIGRVGIAKIYTTTKQGVCGIVVNQFTSNLFLKYWFIFNINLLKRFSQGSSIKEVRPPTLIKFDISTPSLPEQTKIANFLSSIDSKIEQVGKQLDESKQFKKALLQQMFV